MLLSDHFVFVHLLKSGGTFVKRILFDNAPAQWHCVEVGGHPSVDEVPAEYRDKPFFGFIRNPWDWYVSCYHYFKTVDKAPLFDQISMDGTLSFAETFWRALDAEPFKSAGVGPLTYFARHTYGADPAQCRLLRFESLRDDLLATLHGLPVEVPPSLERAILDHPPVNTTEHGHYRDYYDTRLRDKVAELDADLIKRFGYAF